MKQDLITLLETLKYPVFLQGSLNSVDDYPDSFFTFWNFQTPETKFYSNTATAAVWGCWIYFYSTDPALVETVPEAARALLKQNNWTLEGRANDISVDKPTHTGAFFTAYIYDDYKEG